MTSCAVSPHNSSITVNDEESETMTSEDLNQKRADLLALAMDKTNTDEWVWERFPKADPEFSYTCSGYEFYVFPDGTAWVKVNQGETFFLAQAEGNETFNVETGLELYEAIIDSNIRQQDSDAAKNRERIAGWLDRISKDLQ